MTNSQQILVSENDELNNAIQYYFSTFFDSNGVLKPETDTKISRFLQRTKLCKNQGRIVTALPDSELRAHIALQQSNNPYYETLFCKTFVLDGISTIFPLLLKNDKPSIGPSSFDPVKNRVGSNRGSPCRIMYNNLPIIKFMAGNGSMQNVKDQGHTFMQIVGLTLFPKEIDSKVKFTISHKMDGRYVAIYITKIKVPSGDVTITTIHSRGGNIIGSGIFIGPETEMKNFRIEYDVVKPIKTPILEDDNITPKNDKKGKPMFSYIDTVIDTRSYDVCNTFESFVPGSFKRQVNCQEVIFLLISVQEAKTAFEISGKLNRYLENNEMMLVNCEGTKDNMRPLYDKYIQENQDKFSGLFPHPFGTVVYDIINETTNPEMPKRYLKDPIIFTENNIIHCRIFNSPFGKTPYWTTAEILEGVNKISANFAKSCKNDETNDVCDTVHQIETVSESDLCNPLMLQQNVYKLVDYANCELLSELQQRYGKFCEWISPNYPGHISEGVIISAHMIDGSVAYIKVKDDQFADEEEKIMKLPDI